MKTRILLVDDRELVREGLRLMLQNQPGLEAVGGAGNGATALAQAKELMPDLIVMDLQLFNRWAMSFIRKPSAVSLSTSRSREVNGGFSGAALQTRISR
jgi:DNA-binding NarL/FixJ family response regulator